MNISTNTERSPSAPQGRVNDSVGPVSGALPDGRRFTHRDEAAAVVERDGVLKVGAFTLTLDSMTRYLDAFARLTTRIGDVFPDERALVNALPYGSIPVPPASLDFPRAFETFKLAQARELHDLDFAKARKKVEALTEGQTVSEAELVSLRGLLMRGAQLATVCAGIDSGVAIIKSQRSSVQRLKDRVVDFAGSVSLRDGRIQARLHPMPFEDLNPRMLRVDADVMAQRIDLRDDGSLAVRRVCSAEKYAADLLSQGKLDRFVMLSQGTLEGRILVREDGGATLYGGEHRIEDVFSALQLGQSASDLITSLTRKGVDLVRLCRFYDRGAATGLKACLGFLSPQAHHRLSDLDEWGPRFDRKNLQPLSSEDRAELGVLLLDAQLCLYVVGHLQVATQGEDAQKFWSRLWGGAIQDREVRVAQELVSNPPSPLRYDCDGASEIAGSASMLLGYHYEDRSGAAWRVPENPVVSLAWAMRR